MRRRGVSFAMRPFGRVLLPITIGRSYSPPDYLAFGNIPCRQQNADGLVGRFGPNGRTTELSNKYEGSGGECYAP